MHEHSRREFLALTAAVGAAGLVTPHGFGSELSRAGRDELTQAANPQVVSAGNQVVRIGLIGCGGRGSGAANDTLTANKNVRIVAMADIDLAKAKVARDALKAEHGERVDVTDERIFGGIDGYQKVIDLKDVDLVILATAPGFRPIHIAAAVGAKKHVFAEKPVCVDTAGYRVCCAAHDLAKSQGTAIVTGTQYRRQPSFIEGIKRIREGMIGEVVGMTNGFPA